MPWLTNGRDAFIEGQAPDEMLCPSISSLPEEADFERPTCAVLRRTLGRYSRLAANGHEGSLAPRRATGGGERGGENPSPHRSCRSGRGGAESRRAIAGSLPARSVNQRLPGGACCPPGQGRAEPIAGRYLAANGGVAGGLRRMGRSAISRHGDPCTCGADGSTCRPDGR